MGARSWMPEEKGKKSRIICALCHGYDIEPSKYKRLGESIEILTRLMGLTLVSMTRARHYYPLDIEIHIGSIITLKRNISVKMRIRVKSSQHLGLVSRPPWLSTLPFKRNVLCESTKV